jgi:nucleoside-diphosphate-sugar epimerase
VEIVDMLYLITGGAGFIGSNLAKAMLDAGNSVRVLDNFSSGKWENLNFPVRPAMDIIEGDIRDLAVCRQAVRGADFVLHHAALASVPLSVEDPVLANDINVNGTLNMLVASRDAGIKRFVFASSTAVYGDTDDGESPKVETMKPAPLSPYAVNKLTGEEYCRMFYQIYGLETVTLRYFNVFGPKQDPASEYAAVIPKFIEALLSGQAPVIYGDGNQSRDFIYIDDVARANRLACDSTDAAGRIFNIGCGRQVPINELLKELREILKSEASAIYRNERPGDIRHSWADISLARKSLGFEPAFSFRDALLHAVSWYRGKNGPDNKERLR